MRLEAADQHFFFCAHILPFHTMSLKVIQFAKDVPKRLGQRKLPSFVPISSASVAQSISSWSFTSPRLHDNFVVWNWIHYLVCDEPKYTQGQRYFIAYLHKSGCLSQNSTPQLQISRNLYTKHWYIQLPNAYALLFY